MAKVIIDAGHGGFDNGAVYQGRREKDDNLDIALAVGEILQEHGVDVEYTRVEDVYQSPVSKAEIANQIGGDYLISIHRNSSPEPNTYSGAQVLLYDENGAKAEMADDILDELEDVGFHDLGISLRKNLAILRRSQMPALLVEVGFINTDADNALLDARFEETAQAIADGILETLEDTGKLERPQRPPQQMPIYRVQVGLYRNPDNAERQRSELEAKGYPAVIQMFGDLYAVRVGATDSLEEATSLERVLQRQGYDTLIVSE
ncbi:MAG: N-acetylmuramoyl-L-alanine amidase [Lachnospiraceae bacterium]